MLTGNSVRHKMWLSMAGILLSGLLATSAYGSSQPNIVFIMVDDMGSGELQWYPKETDISNRTADSDTVPTPNIFALAKSGVRFTNYRSPAPVCSPARAAILTGQYPQYFGLRDYLPDTSAWELPANTTTIASLLRDKAGYRTGHFGKWHLGDARPSAMPTNFGFEEGFTREGPEFYEGYKGTHFIIDDDVDSPIVVDEAEHSAETITDRAISFIETAESEVEPYFANVSYRAPHMPLDPPANFPNVVPDFDPKPYSDWDQTWLELTGSIPELAQYGYLQNHSNTADAKKRAMFIASIVWLDYQIGRLIKRIDELDPAGNTLVVFVSDNGAPKRTYAQGSGSAPATWEPDADLEGIKKEAFEGGIYVPMIIRWPASSITPGSSITSLTSGFDLLPTLAELASANINNQDYVGRSFATTLSAGTPLASNNSLFFIESRSAGATWYSVNPWTALDIEHNNYAVFDPADNRKLVSTLNKSLNSITRYLVNTNVTTATTNGTVETMATDLSTSEPALATQLESSYRNWRQQVGRIDAYTDPLLTTAAEMGLCLDFTEPASVAVMTRDESFDFSAEDFSFQTRVTLDELPNNDTMTIAEHRESWSLQLKPAPSPNQVTISLTLNGRDQTSATYPGAIGDELALEGDVNCQITCDINVAFTVRGQSDHESTVKLYADGELLDSYVGNTGDSIDLTEVYSNESDTPYLGNDASGLTKLSGTLIDPRFYRIQLKPSEIAGVSQEQNLEECTEGSCH